MTRLPRPRGDTDTRPPRYRLSALLFGISLGALTLSGAAVIAFGYLVWRMA